MEVGSKLVIEEGRELDSMLPQITCDEAKVHADHFEQSELGFTEAFELAVHLSDERIQHAEGCPKDREGLTDRVIALVRLPDSDETVH